MYDALTKLNKTENCEQLSNNKHDSAFVNVFN